MASSSTTASPKSGTFNKEVITLDKPCEYCKLLHLDDAKHSIGVRHGHNGEEYLFFGEVDPFLYLCHEGGDKTLDLGYERVDVLPKLPGFAATASQGCAFCEILRRDIIAFLPKLGDVLEGIDGSNGPQAKLHITEVSYKLEKDEVERGRRSLDAIYVYFTVELGGKVADNLWLHYNIYAETHDPCATWFNIRKKPFSNSLLSTRAVRRLRELIAQSLDKVSTEEDDGYLPTRLLDVGLATEPCLRLVSMKNRPRLQPAAANPVETRYAAISYCWGTKEDAKKQLKTTRNTLQQHLSGIELQDMPQTIADAVRLCRAIGLRYLWVDALCIIQDDDDDWTRESFEMSHIYGNSFITLCVVTGTCCSAGFLEKRHNPNTLQINFKSKVNSSVQGKLFLRMYKPAEKPAVGGRYAYFENKEKFEPEIHKWQLEDAPWFQRGWTFQESYFPKRKLLIGDEMAYMWHEDQIESMDGTRYHTTDRFQLDLGARKSSKRSLLLQWYALVIHYAQRSLSYERDRLPALSGLARAAAKDFHDTEYLAGLWKHDLCGALYWISKVTQNYHDYIKQRQQEYAAPSWSWASRPGHILPLLDGDVPKFELRDAKVVTDKLNRYGRVFSAYLELSAKVLPLEEEEGEDSKKRRRIKRDPERGIFSEKNCWYPYVLLSENGDYVADLMFDWDVEGSLHDEHGCPYAPTDEMRMLLISSSSYGYKLRYPETYEVPPDPESMFGLLVMPTQKAGEFTRVGLWLTKPETGGRRLWEDVQSQIIRLL